MSTKNFLDLLLRSGTELFQNQSKGGKPALDVSSIISGKGGAALAGGALGLLLGTKSGRKIGGNVLAYGGMAMLGTLAYKAFQNYQQQSAITAANPVRPLDQLPANESEALCKAVIVALIAASKADGHIDDRERQLIESEVAKFSTISAEQQWLQQELNKPLDPAEVARYAKNPATAAEMYLASLLATDQQNFMEKTYLDELARQLKLPPELLTQLAHQVSQATAPT